MHTLYFSCPVSYNKSCAYGITIIIIMIVDLPVDLYLLSSPIISAIILSIYDNHVDYSILGRSSKNVKTIVKHLFMLNYNFILTCVSMSGATKYFAC